MSAKSLKSAGFGVAATLVLALVAATLVLGWIGFGEVARALASLGWRGLAFLTVYSALPFSLLGAAWWVVNEKLRPSQLPVFIWARVARDAGSEILPFSHLGGFVVGIRAAVLCGVDKAAAWSTTAVDVTTEIIAQMGFTALGLGLLIARLDGSHAHSHLVEAIVAGLVITFAICAMLITLQRRGGGLAERLVARLAPQAAEGAAEAGVRLRALYDSPIKILAAVAIHLAAWFASAFGVWAALRLGGARVSFEGVLAIESLVSAARSAAFIAPMGIGVQEASYALIGPLFGLPADLALALSLLKRAREVLWGAPALLAWQAHEGRRLFDRSAPAR